jgi:hypothetical protein
MNKALKGQSRAADREPLTPALRLGQSLAPTSIVARPAAAIPWASHCSDGSVRRRASARRSLGPTTWAWIPAPVLAVARARRLRLSGSDRPTASPGACFEDGLPPGTGAKLPGRMTAESREPEPLDDHPAPSARPMPCRSLRYAIRGSRRRCGSAHCPPAAMFDAADPQSPARAPRGQWRTLIVHERRLPVIVTDGAELVCSAGRVRRSHLRSGVWRRGCDPGGGLVVRAAFVLRRGGEAF